MQNNTDQIAVQIAVGNIRSAIRCYLLQLRSLCTEDRTIVYIKEQIRWGVSKQRLQKIVDEFKNYKESILYKRIIERCREEKIL